MQAWLAAYTWAGLSPRGRGKLAGASAFACARRSIPAWAGETSMTNPPRAVRRVYPRVGGGNAALIYAARFGPGLSPRGRGKPMASHSPGRGRRSIPAWAGETYGPGRSAYSRGGSIPAWAGETSQRENRATRTPVYPRVGGGNLVSRRGCDRIAGLSPRGRGKPILVLYRAKQIRSIPAWAGETRLKGDRRIAVRVYPRVGGGNTFRVVRRLNSRGLSPRGRGKPL